MTVPGNQTPENRSVSRGLAPWRLATGSVTILVTLGWIWFTPGEITWYDSGELVAAAFHLGLSHPPGQPLYGLLGKLASLMPIGSVAFLCNLLSALAGGAALAALARMARRGGGELAALVAVALAALNWPMAQQTMRAEVYAPALAGILWALVLAQEQGSSRAGRLGAASLLAGLSAGLHPLLAALAWLGMILATVANPEGGKRLKLLGAALLGAILGNLVWLALPAAGNRPELLPWSRLDSLQGVFATITAEAYRQNLGGGSLDLSLRLIGNGRLLGNLAGPLLTASGILGLAAATLRRRDGAIWPAWVLSALGLASAATMAVFYPANPDLHGYLLPSLAGLALAAGVGLVRIRDLALFTLSENRRNLAHLGAALLGGLLILGSAWHQAGSIADQTVRVGGTDAYVSALSASARPGPGLVVASSDHGLFALVYAKALEGWRPDLALASRWFVGAKAPWYRRWLKHRWPWVFVPLVDDNGPRSGLRERFETVNARRHPTYLEEPPEALWRWVQDCGLFYALVPKGTARRDCVGWHPGPLPLAPIQTRLIGCYMACSKARFLASKGRLQTALEILEPFLEKPLPGLPPLASEFLCSGARPLVLAAKLQMAAGRSREGERLLRRAISLDPRFADSYVELGRLLAARGLLQAAMRMELRALALDGRNVAALFYLALIEHRLGHPHRAQAILSRARAIDPAKVELLLRAHGANGPR